MDSSFLGFIGSICLAVSAAPQAFKSWKEGHSKGLADLTLWLWFIGEVLMFLYVLINFIDDYPLVLNYGANLIIMSVILKYKYFERTVI